MIVLGKMYKQPIKTKTLLTGNYILHEAIHFQNMNYVIFTLFFPTMSFFGQHIQFLGERLKRYLSMSSQSLPHKSRSGNLDRIQQKLQASLSLLC